MQKRTTDLLYLIAFPLLLWIIAGASFTWVASFLYLRLESDLALQNLLNGAAVGIGMWADFMFLITIHRESRNYFFEGEETPLSGIISCLVGLMIAIPALLIVVALVGFFLGVIWWLLGYNQDSDTN